MSPSSPAYDAWIKLIAALIKTCPNATGLIPDGTSKLYPEWKGTKWSKVKCGDCIIHTALEMRDKEFRCPARRRRMGMPEKYWKSLSRGKYGG